jgi:hypothetical protein
MSSHLSAAAWERMYAPYDQPTYQAVLEMLKPGDVVLDIGAGDLRLSRQMALVARKVYAVEISASVLKEGLGTRDPLPGNLIPIHADARVLDFPSGLSTGVLMMRHCTHFQFYMRKLRAAGARRLITNARWRLGVEVIDLWAERKSFREVGMGWYACLCGGTGFKEGLAEQWSLEMDKVIQEVANCPQCK